MVLCLAQAGGGPLLGFNPPAAFRMLPYQHNRMPTLLAQGPASSLQLDIERLPPVRWLPTY